VQLLDEALEAAVKLSHRYIPARQLPDKAVSLLDTACARVAVSQHATPAEVDDCRKRIEALNTELAIIGREKAVGIDRRERDAARSKLARAARLAELEARWKRRKALVDELLALRAKLRDGGQAGRRHRQRAAGGGRRRRRRAAAAGGPGAPPPMTARGAARRAGGRCRKLAELQGETPLILPTVDYQAVASVVADWTGIPVGRMVKNEIEAVLKLPTR
jgi:type VI secretion system protein VasG